MNDYLTYEEVEALKKGDRLLVNRNFAHGHHPATVVGTGTLSSVPSVWVHFDDEPPGTSVNISTGMQWRKPYWNESSIAYKFKRIKEVHE